jgi:hypothetical protein
MIDTPFGGNSGTAQRATAALSQNPDEGCLLTKNQLARRLGLPSARGVEELVRRKAIPVIRLGHRTRRFSWPDVLNAVGRLTIREVQ